MKPKHGLLLFVASCIPGCGEMYQGYMKRGVSILTAFCGIFALAVFLEIGALAVLMLPLWLFSFFDSYNLRSLLAQDAAPADAYLFGLSDVDSQRMSNLLRKRHSLVGWVLVLLGVYILFDTFVGRLMQLLCEWMGQWWLYDVVMRDVPRMVVTIFLIALGIWFIRGPKKAKAEDIPVFTPLAEKPDQAEDAEEAETAAAEQEDGHGDE